MNFEDEFVDKQADIVSHVLAYYKDDIDFLYILIEYRKGYQNLDVFGVKNNKIIRKEVMDRADFTVNDFLEEVLFFIRKEFKALSEKYNVEVPSEIKIFVDFKNGTFNSYYHRYAEDNEFLTTSEMMKNWVKKIKEELNITSKKLSDVIQEYKEITQKECYGIEVIEDEIPDILDDKIGGTPYLPVGVEWPEGMNLLLQVNLKNIELEHFPKEGILEIFVSSDCDSPCETKVFIFDEGLEYQTDLPEQDMDEFFVTEPLKIKLEKVIEHMPINNDAGNKKFCDMIKKYFDFQDEEIEIEEFAQLDYYEEFFEDQEDVEAYNNIDDGVTKANIGGYPAYTQENEGMFDLNEDICIFKLDSYLNDSVNIGDSGILNITMSMEDFKKRDFSNVSGYWDCF